MRIHGLAVESIDLEEFACIGAIESPDFSTFISEQRRLYPYGAPLAPVLIYFWSRIAGDSIGSIRLLFAVAGILVMLLGYSAGLVFFPDSAKRHRIALIVLVCIALSPVHVFHSQEARMYALVSLFTLSGMISFLFALQGHRRLWCVIHLASNICLIASHYFTVFILPVYGIVLLLYERRLTVRLLLWGTAHILLAVMLVLWVSTIPKQAEELYSYYEMPSAYNVLIHLIASDSTNLSATSFFPSSASWSIFPSSIQHFIQDNHIIMDILLGAISVFSIVIGAIFLIISVIKRKREELLHWSALLLWALLPTAIVVTISIAWQPIYGSRYIMYSVFSLYLLAGGIIGRLSGKYLYSAMLLFITIVYAYQLSIALPPQTRTAWRQAYEHVCHGRNGPALLLLEDPFFLPVLEINLPDQLPVPITAAFSRDTLCTASALLSSKISGQNLQIQPDIWVLLVLTTNFDETPFATCLSNANLQFKRYFYTGERNLALYHISTYSGKVLNTDNAENSQVFLNLINELHSYKRDINLLPPVQEIKYLSDTDGGFWLRLGIALSTNGQHALASIAFSKATRISLDSAARIINIASQIQTSVNMNLLAEEALKNTETSCDRLKNFMQTAYYANLTDFIEALGISAQATCTESFVYQGIAAYKKGMHKEAVFFFEQYPNLLQTAPPEIIECFAVSLTETKEYNRAASILAEGIEKWPSYHWLYMRMGIAEAALGNHETALKALRISHKMAPDNGYIIYLMIESLLALKEYGEASELSALPAIVSGKDSWVLWARWRAFTGAGKDNEAQSVFQQLASNDKELQPIFQHLYIDKDTGKVNELLNSLSINDDAVFPEVYMLMERLNHH